MWFPFIALSTTLGPSAVMAAVIYISRKIVYFYDEVSDFTENIVEVKQNQEIIIKQQQELLVQKEKSFDYSSYLTYDMLFKVTLIIVGVVGCVYCYNAFMMSSSDVLSTLKNMDTSNKENFCIVNQSIVDAITHINNSTTKTVGNSCQGVISVIENQQILNEQTCNGLLQKISEAFNNQSDSQVKLSQIEYKMLKNILEIVSKKGISENNSLTTSFSLNKGFTLLNPREYDNN